MLSEEELNAPIEPMSDGRWLYYHRDGTPAKTQGEMLKMFGDDRWNEDNPDCARVGETEKRGVRVSTVFLVIDHGWMLSPPMIFETMVFGGKYDGAQVRYSTELEALANHRRIVRIVHGWRRFLPKRESLWPR